MMAASHIARIAPAAARAVRAPSLLSPLFASSLPFLGPDYRPRPLLVVTGAAADFIIATSYTAIFLALFWLGGRIRRVPQVRGYLWICAAFGSFIIACAATRILEVLAAWLPILDLVIAAKVICASVSFVTACLLVHRIPDLARRLQQLIERLAAEAEQANALRRSEALLDRTNRIAGIGGWELDLTTNEVTWSAETARLHGLPAGHRPSLEEGIRYYDPEYHAFIRSTLQTAMLGGGGWDLELPLMRADKRRIWVRLIGEAESVGGKPIRLFGSLQDKTKEIQQREALRKSELLLDRANRISGMGGWELDLVTNEVTWSAEAARIHGVKPGYRPTLEEGMNYFAPEGQPSLHDRMQRAMLGGGGWDAELLLVRADGGRRQVRHIGDVEFLDGRPVKLFGSIQDITDEAARREALRKAQLFLDRTSKVARIGGWEFDLVTQELTWSDQTARIHGMPPGHKPSYEESLSYFPSDSHPSILAAVENAVATGTGYELELPLMRPDGTRIWVSLIGEIESLNGKPVRIFGSLQDKTLVVEQRELIRKSQLFLDRTNTIAGVGGWEVDILNDTVTWSAETYRIHGLSLAYVPTVASGISFYAENDRSTIAAAVERALDTGQPWDLELQLVRADDRAIWVRTTGNVEMEDGRPVRIVGAIQDKTAQVEGRLALQRQHELLSVTLASIGDAVLSVDTSRNVQWMNGAAERLTGFAAAEAIGKSVTGVLSILYEESRQPAPIYIDPAVPSSRRIAMMDRAILVSRDGSHRSVESCATPIYDTRAELAGSVIVISDVTDQLRHARETEQLHKLKSDLKLKDEFLSHVSHELRSPLTSVYSFTSIIADNLAGDTTEEQQQFLEIILKNVLQLQAMIEDLLTVTQSKEGRLPIDLQNVDAAAAVLDSIHTAHAAAAAKQITITLGALNDLPQAWSDPTRLRQIMIILLDNAVKFTPEGGQVTVRIFEDEAMLHFEVEDNGCGVPLDKRARVFEKLYQITAEGHMDTSQQGRIGLGLGLHIARDLVRRQGGNIWITGDPALGSVFNFTLPLASRAAESGTHPLRRKSDWPDNAESQLDSAA